MQSSKKCKKKHKKEYNNKVIDMSIIGICIIFFIIFIGYITEGSYAIGESKNNKYENEITIYNNKKDNKTLDDIIEKNILNTKNKLIKKNIEYTNVNFNLYDDSSLQKYVGKESILKNIYYKPNDLEKIKSEYVIIKTNSPLLRKSARMAFELLAEEFYREFNRKLYLVSAYRSFDSQSNLIKRGCSLLICAEPGTSEHQLGLAVDIHTSYLDGNKTGIPKGSKYYEWLSNNAHKFGFHNTYQKGLHTDGQIEEGRHRRYLTIQLATFLFENDLSIGEYYSIKNNK